MVHFYSLARACLRTDWEDGRRNTQRCTCERKRVPEWTDKRFAMCENRFFHSILICFRNSRRLRLASGRLRSASRREGKRFFENMRVKLVQDEAAKRKLSPPTRSFSFFEQASEKHSLLDVRVLAEKSSFQSKSDREQETIAVVSLVIIEFAYKRVRIETCCKQRKIIPYVVSDKSLPGEIIVQ